MKYFVPELVLGALSPPQAQLADKFGGLPWGLPVAKWPLCRECGNPQTHLATFTHHAERLDLGVEGRVVMVFQCGHFGHETDCEPYDPNSGANAVVFLETYEVGYGLTSPPAVTPKEIELRVSRWIEEQDLVTPELESLYYPPEGLWFTADGKWIKRDEAREAVDNSIGKGAKLGSVPYWVQEPEKVEPGFRFAAQLAMSYHLPDPLPSADAVGAEIWVFHTAAMKEQARLGVYDLTQLYDVQRPTHPDPSIRGGIGVSHETLKRYGPGFVVDAAEFGDGGSGFLFIQSDPVAPRGLFLWQSG